jgi:hypothetical protein
MIPDSNKEKRDRGVPSCFRARREKVRCVERWVYGELGTLFVYGISTFGTRQGEKYVLGCR